MIEDLPPWPCGPQTLEQRPAAEGHRAAVPAAALSADRTRPHEAAFDKRAVNYPVVETVEFTRDDLRYAWDVHVNGPHHDAVGTLTTQQAQAFQADYTGALSELLSTDEDQLLNPEVIYAFGGVEG